MLNRLSACRFEQAEIEAADLRKFRRELMKNAVLRLDFKTVRIGASLVTKLRHVIGDMGESSLGILRRVSAKSLAGIAPHIVELFAGAFAAKLRFQGLHQHLGKPGILPGKPFLTALRDPIQLLGAAACRLRGAAGHYSVPLQGGQVLAHRIAADTESSPQSFDGKPFLVMKQGSKQRLLGRAEFQSHATLIAENPSFGKDYLLST